MPVPKDAFDRLQIAAGPMRAVVGQCVTHAETAAAKLADRMERASARSPFGEDRAAARAGRFRTAYRQRLSLLDDTVAGFLAQLEGLNVLLANGVFLPTPAVSIVRSVAEISASTAWLLRADVSVEDRAARSYAAVFRAIEKANHSLGEGSDLELPELRERLVAEVREEGAIAVRRVWKGVEQAEIASVTVGRAHAKVEFQYTRRVAAEIPQMGTLYSALSGIAHGEQMHLSSVADSPDSLARLIARIAQWSVQAWSSAVHGWVGVQHGPFINRQDLVNLLNSTPEEHRMAFGVPEVDETFDVYGY